LALAGIAAALYAFYGLFDAMRARLLIRISRSVDASNAGASFDDLMAQLDSRSDRQKPAATADLNTLRDFLSSPAAATLFDIPWFPVYLAFVFFLHPLLGTLALAGAVLLIAISLINGALGQRFAKRASTQGDNDRRFLADAVRQSETISAMGMAGSVRQIWHVLRTSNLDQSTAQASCNAMSASLARTLRLILQSAILGVGAYLVILGQLSPGALIAASIIFGRALAPVDQSIAQWRLISEARAAYRRLARSLKADDSVELPGDVLALPENSLQVSALAIRPPNAQLATVNDMSFTLAAGDGLAVVGESGGGKTTLLRGLLGLWPIVKGEVRLDGATLDQWPEDKRRQIIGYAAQDSDLLPGTVAQNISRFIGDADPGEIAAAAEMAGAHDLIVHLPKGYDTPIGPGGFALSGGQKQRIILARAVFGDPFLVILDEPNSNLDARGERMLGDMIKTLRERGAIVIMTTHHGLLQSNLNKLLVVENGRQAAFGGTSDVIRLLAAKRDTQKKDQRDAA
jgi:ATP-binding cassette subfamily C protein